MWPYYMYTNCRLAFCMGFYNVVALQHWSYSTWNLSNVIGRAWWNILVRNRLTTVHITSNSLTFPWFSTGDGDIAFDVCFDDNITYTQLVVSYPRRKTTTCAKSYFANILRQSVCKEKPKNIRKWFLTYYHNKAKTPFHYSMWLPSRACKNWW